MNMPLYISSSDERWGIPKRGLDTLQPQYTNHQPKGTAEFHLVVAQQMKLVRGGFEKPEGLLQYALDIRQSIIVVKIGQTSRANSCVDLLLSPSLVFWEQNHGQEKH
jgi:hypothetical protein